MTSCDYDYMNFIASVLKVKRNWLYLNYWIPIREEIPIEVAISLLWNAFIHFFCKEWKVRYHYCTEWCKYKKDLKICNSLIYLDDKTRSFTLFKYVCMYVFAIDKKSLKIVDSLILQSEKLSNKYSLQGWFIIQTCEQNNL